MIAPGRLQGGGRRAREEIADYVLVYRNQKLAVIEAKRKELPDTEGLGQAKRYAERLQTRFAYSTNGVGIYRADMATGDEGYVDAYPTPEELWEAVFGAEQGRERFWRERFAAIPFEIRGGQWEPRYYQHNAITRTLEAIGQGRDRILLTLAAGTGKTAIAFQIAWKLFHSRWNLTDWRNGLEPGQEPKRRPRILFLADRNILADQAFNNFSAFPEDALVRIAPDAIAKKGKVPKNGSIFFTIFQTFMTGTDENGDPSPYFGDYPPDFFDFIVIDECHRGGAGDESAWRGIMEYFAPAVQLGLTATPKRTDNVDTYAYFGEPVYVYSLKQGINDGYLTPFRVKQISTTIDSYIYTSDDKVIEGEIQEGKTYEEAVNSLASARRPTRSHARSAAGLPASAKGSRAPSAARSPASATARRISREQRVEAHRATIHKLYADPQREFLDFVLAHYVEQGVDELNQDKLPDLLRLHYHDIPDAVAILGQIPEIRDLFVGFQKYLYEPESVA